MPVFSITRGFLVSALNLASYEGPGLWPGPHLKEKEAMNEAQQPSGRWEARRGRSLGTQCADLVQELPAVRSPLLSIRGSVLALHIRS